MATDDVIDALRRRASVAAVGGFRPPADPITSWLGQVLLLGQDEAWPTCDGVPMVGVCQIVVGELPYVPPQLDGTAVLTLFMRSDAGEPSPPLGVDDPGWELRTYSAVAELVAVEPPGQSALRPFPVRWREVVSDLPAREDAMRTLARETFDEIDGAFAELVSGPTDGFKVGGWPSLIQGEISWAPWNRHPARPEYVLQIDSDEKTGIAWGDTGVMYVGRGTADPSAWALEWQCM